MKKYNVTLMFVLVFCRLTIQLDGADFNALENAKRLYHIGKVPEALEMCRQAAKTGNIEAQLQLTEWLFAKKSKSRGNPLANSDQRFQKPQMDIERANRHNERLDRAKAEGDQPKQGGDQPKQGGDQPKQGGDQPKQGGDQTKQGGDQTKQEGGEKPKEGIGQVAGKTGQFSPGGT